LLAALMPELPPLTQAEIARYARHLLLPEISMKGQQKLKAASVLIVGAGGLGSPASLYLAAAGVGHLGIVDPDRVDLTNLQRQILHSTSHLDMLKVDSARLRLNGLNTEIKVDIFPEMLTSLNARSISDGYNIILDGTDNIPSRYLLNDLAVLSGKPYVYGSIYRFEGQVSVFGLAEGPCYRCLFPEPPPPGTIPSCATAGVIGVLPGVIGTMQAIEVIKLITGAGKVISGRLLLYDALEASLDSVRIKRNPSCRVCGDHPEIQSLIDYDSWCGGPGVESDPKSAGQSLDISPIDAQMLMNEGKAILVDVREPFELDIARLNGAIALPMERIFTEANQLPIGKTIILFCRNGVRSSLATIELARDGYPVRNLYGGINAWAEQIDQSLAVY
jgi:adenylyltransferase/sulfurtransferase